MNRPWALEAARVDLARLSVGGLDSVSLRTAFLGRLNRLIGFDSAWFALCDPATLLFTGAVRQEMTGDSTPRFVENEFLVDDFNKWVDLAKLPGHSRSLGQATGGDLTSSNRYREILEPLGLGDELRAALLTGSTCWGFVCLHREAPCRRLQRDRVRVAWGTGADTGGGLARMPSKPVAGSRHRSAGRDRPGPDLSVVSMSAAAESWLAEVSDADWPSLHELPTVVHAIASQVRAAIPDRDLVEPRGATLRTRSGAWLTVSASRLAGSEVEGQIAVVLAPTRPVELSSMIMQAYDLTQRECEVTGLVLRGTSTKEVAAALRISSATVQQHLKSIFDKTGVRSRRELAAQIFAGQYQPRMGSRLSPTGWFEA